MLKSNIAKKERFAKIDFFHYKLGFSALCNLLLLINRILDTQLQCYCIAGAINAINLFAAAKSKSDL